MIILKNKCFISKKENLTSKKDKADGHSPTGFYKVFFSFLFNP